VYKLYCPQDDRSSLQIQRLGDVIGLLQNKGKHLEESTKTTQQIRAKRGTNVLILSKETKKST